MPRGAVHCRRFSNIKEASSPKIQLERFSLYGKRWRYFLGEIAITTIGVLIALAANARWQQHVDSLSEGGLLREMKAGLVTDVADMRDDQAAYSIVRDATLALESHFRDHRSYEPELDSLFGVQVLFRSHLPSASAWETLKQRGVSLVSDDSLRLRIMSHYEFDTNLLSSRVIVDENIVFDAIRPYYRRHFMLSGGHGIQARAHPIDYDVLSGDSEFRYMLAERRDAVNSALAAYDGSIASAEWIIRRIDERLAQRRR